jgi:death-on-curing family protein
MVGPVYYLTLEDTKEICFHLVQQLLQFEEPLPDFETRFPAKLESVLEIPKQQFGENEFYPTIFEKSACYFYFIIKNHPFLNGNKRLAIVMTYVFLRFNHYNFKAPWKSMYSFAIELAGSTKNHKKEFKEVVIFIKSNSEKLAV